MSEIEKLVDTMIEKDSPITKEELRRAKKTAAARYKAWLEQTEKLKCRHTEDCFCRGIQKAAEDQS
jgi:hypothetical protein